MKRLILLAALVLATLAPSQASAQALEGPHLVTNSVGSSPVVQGTVATSTDTVSVALSGTQWSHATFVITGTFVGSLVPEYTWDNLNWNTANSATSSAPMAIKLTASIAIPNAPTPTSTITTTGTWEVPLAADAVAVRLRPTSFTSGTATITAQGSRVYVPWSIVRAKVLDYTSASGAATPEQLIDTHGWSRMTIVTSSTGATAGTTTLRQYDESGTSLGTWLSPTTVASGASAISTWGVAGGVNTPYTGGSSVGPLALPPRLSISFAAAASAVVRTQVYLER